MTENKVVSLGARRVDKKDDNTLWTPIECLREAEADFKGDDPPFNSVMVVKFRRSTEDFSVSLSMSNVDSSTALAVLEVCRITLLRSMGFIKD